MKRQLILVALLLCAVSVLARADDDVSTKMEARLKQLEQNQQALQKQIQEMKEQLLDSRIDRKVVEEHKKLRLTTEWKNGFHMRTADNSFHMQVGGRLQFHGIFSVDDDDAATDTFQVRRAYIRTNGHLFKYYYWMIIFNTAGSRGGGSLEDAWIDIRYTDKAKMKFGQFIRPIGQETQTSNKYIKMVERSMASKFIAGFYEVGAMLHGNLFDKKVMYQLALLNGNGSNRTDENDDKEGVARIVFKPWAGSDNTWLKGLQFGAAGSYGHDGSGSVAGGGPSTAPGTRVYRYASGTRRDGDKKRWNAQMAWNIESFTLRGEFMELSEQIARGGTHSHVRHQGWYVTTAYLLTGEKQGFGRVTPLEPFDPHDPNSGWGAWEIAARIGQIRHDSDSFVIDGNRGATQYMAALNWYPNSAVRFSLNYQHAAFDGVVGRTSSEDTIMLRIQIEY